MSQSPHSDCSYPSTDESSIDSSDDENFRRPPRRNAHQETAPSTRRPAEVVARREPWFVHNVCDANGTELAGKKAVTMDLPYKPAQKNHGRIDLKFYQGVIVPLVNQFGWKFDPLEDKYTLQCGSSTIRVSPKVLIETSQAFEKLETTGAAKRDKIKGEWLISKLEEEILFTRTKATIALQGAVAESCAVSITPLEMIHKIECETTPKSEALADIPHSADNTLYKYSAIKDEDLSSTKDTEMGKLSPHNTPRKHDRATSEEKKRKVVLPQDRDSSSISVDLLNFVSCRKVIPKFTTNSLEGEEIFPPTFVHEVIKKVFEDLLQPPPRSEWNNLLNMRISNDSTDPLSLIVQGKGRKDLVSNLLKLVGKRVTSIQALENVCTVLADKKSLEIDVKVDVTEDLGFKVVKPFGSNRDREGIWIASTTMGGQFRDIFGAGTNRGAVLMKVAKRSVFKLADKNRLLAMAKSAYEESGKKGDKWTSVTVCLNRNANLQHLDHTRVIFTNGKSIRFRDGTAYQGKWKIQPPLPHQHRNSLIDRRKVNSMPIKQVTTKNVKLSVRSRKDGQRNLPPHSTLQNQKSEPNLKLSTKFRRDGQQPPSARFSLVKQKSESSSSISGMKDELKINKPKQKSPYEHFRDKVHFARDIEYKHALIHLQTANGSMWNQHKLLYGESCDKNCLCVSNTKGLSKNVVADFIIAQEAKDNMWSNDFGLKSGVSPVGFMSSFCPKFFDKVRQEFSQDTPEETLGKLVVMWKEHIKERIFGLKCRDECPCGEGWEKLFLPACYRLVRKGTAVSNLNSTRQKRALMMVDDVSGREEFALTFNPSKESLGFYCVTRKTVDGTGSHCVITSLDPRGTAHKRDNQIRIGSIVESSSAAVTTLVEKLKVDSHVELKGRYEALKMKHSAKMKTRLKLFFRNTATRQRSGDSLPGKEWTETGAWVGKGKEGWAGGAMIANIQDEMSCTDSHVLTLDKISPKEQLPAIAGKSDPVQPSHLNLIKNQILPKIETGSNIELTNSSTLSPLNLPKKVKPLTTSRVEGRNDLQSPRTPIFQNEDKSKHSGGKNAFAKKEVLANSAEQRHRAFLKRSGISLPRSMSLPTISSLPITKKGFQVSSVPNTLGDCKTTGSTKEDFLGNAANPRKYTSPLNAQQRTTIKQRRNSILKKPGEIKGLRRVSFSASVTGGTKRMPSAGSLHVQSGTRNLHVSRSPVMKSSVNSSTCVRNGEDNKNGINGASEPCADLCIANTSASTYSSVGQVQNDVKRQKVEIESHEPMKKISGSHAMKKCSLCHLVNQEDAFSKTQWRKLNGKCKHCLTGDKKDDLPQYDNYTPAETQAVEIKQCCSCELLLNPNYFSNKQWRNGTLRRCKKCISDRFQQDAVKRETHYNSTFKEECHNFAANNGHITSPTPSNGEHHDNNSGCGDTHNMQNRPTPFASTGGGYSSGSSCSVSSSLSGRGNLHVPAEEVVNVALNNSLEEMKSYLEQMQPTGVQIAPALNAVKRSNIDGSNDQLKKKRIVLKIYSNIFYILGKARDLKDFNAPSTGEYREERKMILKELHEKGTWIEQFQMRERAHNRHSIIDGNISLTCGFTMLHAAVILSDPIVTSKIMAIGAYPMARCNRWGSVIEMSRQLQQDAIIHDDRGIEVIQHRICSELEHYQTVACGT